MRIGLGQINATVGDLAGNARRVLDMAREAADAGCELLVTPELALTGYPPQDLLFKPHFITDQLAQLHEQLAPALPLPALIGFVDRDVEGKLYNAAAFVCSRAGAPDGAQDAAADLRCVRRVALLQARGWQWRPCWCWADASRRDDLRGHLGRGYERHVVPGLAQAGARMIVNSRSSPFHPGKRRARSSSAAATLWRTACRCCTATSSARRTS